MSKIALIDFDMFTYRAAYFSNEINNSQLVESNSINYLTSVMEKAGTDRALLLTTHKHLIRKEIFPSYKKSRENKYKDMDSVPQYVKWKSYISTLFSPIAFKVPGYEADDLIAAYASIFDDYIIISDDKDLNQIPGTHMNFSEHVYEVSEEEALYNLCKQVLMGDSTDDIPGLHRVGIKTAEKILQEKGISLGTVLDTYIEKGKGSLQENVDFFNTMLKMVHLQIPNQVIEKYDHINKIVYIDEFKSVGGYSL
jgi:DNA polymerase-1